MKKEELIEYIDGIQPDTYMKTRLCAKVINSENLYRKKFRKVKSIISLCLVAAIVFGVGVIRKVPAEVVDGNSDITQNTPVMDILQPFIMVASAADAENKEEKATTALELNKAYPCGVHLRIFDVSGMSETQKKNLVKKMNNELNLYAGKEGFVIGGSSVVTTDKLYMVICSVNEFRLDIQPDKTLKSINVKNTSPYGQMVYSPHKPSFSVPLHGRDITVQGDEFDSATAGFYWDYTDELVKTLEDNPDTPFSAFDDVITFTVEYTDGSKSVGVVELSFDTYGNAAAICKEYEHRKGG